VKGAGATINGIPIKGAVGWAIQAGTVPFITSVIVDRNGLDDPGTIMGKPVKLSAEGIGGSWEVSGVYVIDYAPGGDPYNWALTLADKRYFWPRSHVMRRYNVRRRTGDRRLLREGFPTQLPGTVDDFAFELSTLYAPGTLWDPITALRDVVSILDDGKTPDIAGIPARSVPLEDVEIDEDGATALTRLLRHVPGAAVFIDENGSTRFFDETEKAAASALLRKMGAPVVGKGIADEVRYDGIRPAWVDVLFSIEQELKFTSIDEGGAYSRRGSKSKDLENVLQVTDETLTLASGRVVTRGTWITMDEAFAAWGSFSRKDARGVVASLGNITHAIVRKYWFGGRLESVYGSLGQAIPEANWVPRIREIRKHYRQTYRITPYWMTRIRSIRAERVAIIDPETGTRAPARVVANYAVMPSMRGRFFDPSLQGYILNVNNVYSDSLAAAGYAPATASILAPDLGIFHLAFETGPNNLLSEVFPCAFEEPIPQGNFAAKVGRNVFGDSTMVKGVAPISLAATHKVAVVLTAVPSAPNSNDQFLRVRINPGDVPLAVGACSGRGWEIRVGPGAGTTARMAWTDAAETLIDKVFGVPQNPSPGTKPTYAGGDALANAGLLMDSAEVRNLALAAAASLYSQMVDRVAGAHASRADTSLAPIGNATAVVHGIDADGAINSIVRFDKTSGRLDVPTFVNNDTRRKLMRMVQP
jgi:hypothetical protein